MVLLGKHCLALYIFSLLSYRFDFLLYYLLIQWIVPLDIPLEKSVHIFPDLILSSHDDLYSCGVENVQVPATFISHENMNVKDMEVICFA